MRQDDPHDLVGGKKERRERYERTRRFEAEVDAWASKKLRGAYAQPARVKVAEEKEKQMDKKNLLWTDAGPLCPACGMLMQPTSSIPGSERQCLQCTDLPAALADAFSNATPAQFVEMALGMTLAPLWKAAINARFMTRDKNQQQILFRAEIGLAPRTTKSDDEGEKN